MAEIPNIGKLGGGTPKPPGGSRPISGLPRNKTNTPKGDKASPKTDAVEGKKKFESAQAAGKKAGASPAKKPSQAKGSGGKAGNLAKKASGLAKNVAGQQSGTSGIKKAASKLSSKKGKEVQENTSNLKKAGQKASKGIDKGKGKAEAGGKDPDKAGIASRAKNSAKNLGKERCKVCGYQNGLNKAGICKKCVKLNRESADDVGKAEKLQNKATDLQAKVAAKAAGQIAEKATLGLANAKIVEKLSEGFIGKTLAAQNKVSRKVAYVAIGVPVMIVFVLMLFIIVAIGGGSADLNYQQPPEGTSGTVANNTSEIESGQLDTYVQVAAENRLPWSILAGVGAIATEHGYVSPYDERQRDNVYPLVSPGIEGEGFGPMLFTGDATTDGATIEVVAGEEEAEEQSEESEEAEVVASSVSTQSRTVAATRIPNPVNMDLRFESRPGEANAGGNLAPPASAAADFIKRAWPNNPIVSDWRPPDGYNEHNSGLALDIGCPGTCTRQDINNLHAVAAWFLQNPKAFEIRHIIWEQRIHSGNSWVLMSPRGNATADHFDHVHIYFKNPNQTSLGPLGGSLQGSSLIQVAANTANNPFNDGSSPAPSTGNSGSDDQNRTDVDAENIPPQNFKKEVERLADLINDARDDVYEENEEKYKDLGLTKDDMSKNPFESPESIEFWQLIIEKLPIDFENIDVKYTVGGNGSTPLDPGSFGPDGSPTVMGGPMITEEQMVSYLENRISRNNIAWRLPETPKQVVAFYYKYGNLEGVRPDWATLQGVAESTTFTSNPPAVRDFNFSGIAHCDACANGWAFENTEKGIQAQIILLKRMALGNDVELKGQEVNPVRPTGVRTVWGGRKIAEWGTLGGGQGAWASAPNYWCLISSLARETGMWWPVGEADALCGRTPEQFPRPEGYTGDESTSTTTTTTPTDLASTDSTTSTTQPAEGAEGSEETQTPPVETPETTTTPPPGLTDKPKETLVALAVIQRAGEYSGVDLELLGAPEEQEGGSDLPGGGFFEGDQSERGFQWPARGYSGPGGQWQDPARNNHRGIDIGMPEVIPGPPVVASKGGEVVYTYNGCGIGNIEDFCGAPPYGGYGNVVVIFHAEDNLYTLYAHLTKGTINVRVGDKVIRGQQVGLGGRSGNSTGVHLHFEIRPDKTEANTSLDPRRFLPTNGP
jgi:murein DD-endopeptidase MepM/ murein hydrolase activator NlpD